jgi:hypothetical protein
VQHVSGAAVSTQWLLRVKEKTKVKTHSGRRISTAKDRAIL